MPSFLSEDDIERALVSELKAKLGGAFAFDTLNCLTQEPDDLNDGSGRNDKRDVFLLDRIRTAAIRLNPYLPESAVETAVSQLTARRNAMSMIAANREVDGMLREGIQVEYDDEHGHKQKGRVQFIEFDAIELNSYLLVTQMWIKGQSRFRRPDVLLYVNGIPLVFIELKNSNVDVRNAYDENLVNYKEDIPQLFHANAICVLTNAIDTRVGSLTAEWEHFFAWLRVDDEKEKIDRKQIKADAASLGRDLDGLLHPKHLLDYFQNFIVYYKESQKVIAQNHQFIGVNNAIERFDNRDKHAGKLGVFWHTQGSGKSFSMIFYVRKIFRKTVGNFTFLVVTDRDDLDGQIYRNFLHTGTVKKEERCRPKNSEELREFLGTNKRMVFTLIHKFRWPKGKKYPRLSERDDIIVIVDEAHRTQYEDLAVIMREGLKNAQFVAFTGTPLLGRARKTNQWFGEYVSEYNFQQSIDDGSTVPLFHQKRVPEVLIQNQDLSEEFYEILEDENLDDVQQEKLERRFAKETEVIKRDDRLDTIARDIVGHFPNRGYLGKAMVITLDKFTAVTMYDKVQHHWKEEIRELRAKINKAKTEEKGHLKAKLDWMKRVEIAVVVSAEADEDKKFAARNLDIKPHRQKLEAVDAEGHDIEFNFKDPNHPLQLVFVCAMWLTGFDAPTVSTLYLDKPMKDHTLMQTIARANRVTSYRIAGKSKANGEIIDYYNVFRNLKKALKDYGLGDDGKECPVQDKTVLRDLLSQALEEAGRFCLDRGMPLDELSRDDDRIFKSIALFASYADILLGNEEWRKSFYVYENTISSLYEACKPEIFGDPIVRKIAVFQYLRGVVEAIVDQQDISEVTRRITELLDESLVVDDSTTQMVSEHRDDQDVTDSSAEWKIIQTGRVWDLSKTNFEKLKADFKECPYKNIEIADLLAFIKKKLDELLKRNVSRRDFAQRLQAIVDRYNSGGSANENYHDELLKFVNEMKAEDERHVREGLTEDELELFDLLKQEKMTEAETQRVKLAAKKLLHRVLEEHPKVLVQDWFKDARTQRIVKAAVEEVLDSELPESYDRTVFRQKCDSVFDTMLDYAIHGVKFAA